LEEDGKVEETLEEKRMGMTKKLLKELEKGGENEEK
jgi:hypothetical protein